MISLDLFWRELINGYGFCIAIKLRYLHIQCYVHAVIKIWLLYNVRSVWSIAQIQMIQKEILSKRNTTTKWSDVFQQKDQPHQIGCSWIILCSEHFRLERLMFAIKHTAALLHWRGNMLFSFSTNRSTLFLSLLLLLYWGLCAIRYCITFFFKQFFKSSVLCLLFRFYPSFSLYSLLTLNKWNHGFVNRQKLMILITVTCILCVSIWLLFLLFYSFYNAELFTLSQQPQQLFSWSNYAQYTYVANMRILCVLAQT